MKNSIIRAVITIVGLITLTGCAGPRNIQLSEEFWQTKNQNITIATFKTPEPQVHVKGEQGLVDLAINSAMNNNMNKALKRTDLSWYSNLYSRFVERFKTHKINSSIVSRQVEPGKKNYEMLLTQANAEGDKLLTLELRAVGARRTYCGFIPTGAPEAYCVVVGELIDPKDKKVWWHHATEIITPVKGPWDQSPHYPNFANALDIAMHEAKQEIVDSFFSGK